jgi:hypothetical protein
MRNRYEQRKGTTARESQTVRGEENGQLMDDPNRGVWAVWAVWRCFHAKFNYRPLGAGVNTRLM